MVQYSNVLSPYNNCKCCERRLDARLVHVQCATCMHIQEYILHFLINWNIHKQCVLCAENAFWMFAICKMKHSHFHQWFETALALVRGRPSSMLWDYFIGKMKLNSTDLRSIRDFPIWKPNSIKVIFEKKKQKKIKNYIYSYQAPTTAAVLFMNINSSFEIFIFYFQKMHLFSISVKRTIEHRFTAKVIQICIHFLRQHPIYWWIRFDASCRFRLTLLLTACFNDAMPQAYRRNFELNK